MFRLGQNRSSRAFDKIDDIRHLNISPVPSSTSLFSFYTNQFREISASDALDESMAVACEPKPFKDGTHLEALANFDAIFVPTERKTDGSPAVDFYDHQQTSLEQPQILQDTSSMQDEHGLISSHPTQAALFPQVAKCFQHQEDRWDEHYQELLRYKKKFGNCHIPQNYPEDLALARWARRQRHQYKLKCQRKKTSMSDERQRLLEQAGFIWDPQTDVWEIRRQELEEYKERHGHCNVPSRYAEKPQLATWVKRQRRQYKQMHSGLLSRLPRERFEILDRMGFVWKHRESAAGGNSSMRV